MTNEQLSVLLWQIMRQINSCANGIERVLIERGCSANEADGALISLRGLADSLQNSCGDLDKVKGR